MSDGYEEGTVKDVMDASVTSQMECELSRVTHCTTLLL